MVRLTIRVSMPLQPMSRFPLLVLGINGVAEMFHDASATLIRDGELIASVEEERFNRRKHSNGVPLQAIEFCLRRAGASFEDLDHIGYYLDPDVLRTSFIEDVRSRYPLSDEVVRSYGTTCDRIASIPDELAGHFGEYERSRFHFLNHHLAHAASAFHVSGFDRAAILTVDGSGDRETATLYEGRGAELHKVCDFLVYPQSLGFVYAIMARHLGLGWVEGSGKLMGLAGFGKPDLPLFDDIVRLLPDPRQPIDIDLSFFEYHTTGEGLSPKGIERFGPPRDRDDPLEQRHMDLSATTQALLERALLHLAEASKRLLPDCQNLCFAGGVALNVLANRRLHDSPLFDKLFVTPAAYDGGTSLGCALHLSAKYGGVAQHPFSVYLGPDIEKDFDLEGAIEKARPNAVIQELEEDQIAEVASELLVRNKIIGWAQGRMECGPRALGGRSFLTAATRPDAKDDLNSKVKRREGFRPYAPSVLEEHAADWFDLDRSPHMLLSAQVKRDRREAIPGVVHIDGSSRPHTVTEDETPRYYRLLQRYYEKTGVPVVVNTSLNRHGEPIVNTPEEALATITAGDLELYALFLGRYCISHEPLPEAVLNTASYSVDRAREYWRHAPSGDGKVDASRLLELSDAEFEKQWQAAYDSRRRVYWDEAPQVEQLAKAFAGKRALSFGSGLGLNESDLLQAGVRLSCVDIVPESLEVIRRISALRDWPFEGGIRSDQSQDFGGPYDCIVSWGSLMTMPWSEQEATIQRFTKALAPGGRLVLMLYTWRFVEETVGVDSKTAFALASDPSVGELDCPWSDWHDDAKVERLCAPNDLAIVSRQLWNDELYVTYEIARSSDAASGGDTIDPMHLILGGRSPRATVDLAAFESHEATLRSEGTGLVVTTHENESLYAASAIYEFDADDELVVLDMEVSTGRLSFGVIDTETEQFIASVTLAEGQRRRVPCRVPSRRSSSCRLVLSNFQREPSISELRLHGVEVYAKA